MSDKNWTYSRNHPWNVTNYPGGGTNYSSWSDVGYCMGVMRISNFPLTHKTITWVRALPYNFIFMVTTNHWINWKSRHFSVMLLVMCVKSTHNCHPEPYMYLEVLALVLNSLKFFFCKLYNTTKFFTVEVFFRTVLLVLLVHRLTNVTLDCPCATVIGHYMALMNLHLWQSHLFICTNIQYWLP